MQTQIFMVHKRHLGLRAPTVLAVGFALTILVGALVLMLPVSAADGQITPFLDALFTAASASCVTGLVTVSTAVHWSVFGKCVILLLIQIGGLGFMSVAAIASFVLRRTITLHERMVMSAGLNLSDGGGIVRLTRRVLFGTFIIEGAGAILLSCRFVPHYGFPKGITMGVFHAVSCLLMFIGGSPGSTAGGIKTVTAAVLVLTAISAFCGRTTVSAFGRTIAPRSIMNAVALLMAGGVFCLVGACAIAGIEDAPFHQCLFEAVSAFGTVGVSMGLTPTLAAASRVILIVMMYMGRVGVLTLGVAVFMRRREPPRLKYPDADVFIG